ncbi:MAG: VWA domain-containing protein [Candidatus Altiarchaeota archaeon]|nr:VWA domain-containing protein [Candidatus Altiarchaeota archaeon]
MKDKGYAVIMDALMALFIFLVVVTVMIGPEYFRTPQSDILNYKKLNYWADDSLDVMNKKAVLDEIAYHWSMSGGNRSSPNWTVAESLCRNYTNKILPQSPGVGYSMLIGGMELCNSSGNINRTLESMSDTKGSASRLLVGFGANKTVKGFIANALLADIKSKYTSSFAFFGGFVGNGNITRFIELPDDAEIDSVYMELNAGDDFNLYINGTQCDGPFIPGGSGMAANVKATLGCTNLFKSGNNTIDIKFTGGNLSKAFIGGGFIQVKHKTSDWSEPYQKRYYFPGIHGFINLYSSFYVPDGMLSSITGYLHYKRPTGEGKNLVFKVGNMVVYNSTDSGDVTATIPDFSAGSMVASTTPIRMFIEGGNGTADVVLSTDLSASMKTCMDVGGFRVEDWSIGECNGFWADLEYGLGDDYLNGEDNRWTFYGSGWGVDFDDSTLYESSTGSRRASIDVTTLSTPAAGDFTASFRMMMTSGSGNRWAGMVIRKASPDHSYSESGYLILYEWDGTLRLWSDGANLLPPVNLPIAPNNTWREIDIVASGNNIRVSVDGTEYIDHTDAASTYSHGFISLQTDGGVRVKFDDIQVVPAGADSSICPDLGVCYFFDDTLPDFLYEDISLHHLTEADCGSWVAVPNCVGGTPLCYCNPCANWFQVAECGGDTVGGSYDACCAPDTCCAGLSPCCERDDDGGHSTALPDCTLATWNANHLSHCRTECDAETPWALGDCAANAFTWVPCRSWCDEGSDPPPGTWGTFCHETRAAWGSDGDMGVGGFTANCDIPPENQPGGLPDSTTYQSQQDVCNGDCNNPLYERCSAEYDIVGVVGSCPSGEYCQCFTEGAGEVCYEFDRTLRGYRRYWRDCTSWHGNGYWAIYEDATPQCWDCTSFDDHYTCRSDYVSAGMDDSDWDTITTPDTPWGCDRCSRFYRHTFNVPDTTLITWLELNISCDDGAVCYINGNPVLYDPQSQGMSTWNEEVNVNPGVLVNGNNIIACQVKEYRGGEGFNLRLGADTGLLIDTGASWLYHHQDNEDYCVGESSHRHAPNYRYDPDSSSCEYGVWVDDCGSTYPADQPAMDVAAWTRRDSESNYNNGFKPVAEYLARMLGGEFIESESGYGGDPPASFWNSADVLIVDGYWADPWHQADILTALANGKIVITSRDNFFRIRSNLGNPPYETTDSYDHRCHYFDQGPGRFIGDQYEAMSDYWRSSSHVRRKEHKAANLLNAIYPVWYNGDDPTHVCQTEYCIPGGGSKGCVVCNITRINLAKDLDEFFAHEILSNASGANIGLVGYGSEVTQTQNLTSNIDLLNETIDNYNANSGFTCISCAIWDSIKMLNDSSTGAKKQYMIIMSDGEANTCINDNVKGAGRITCQQASPYGATNASNETILLGCMAHEVYNITVYTIGFALDSPEGRDTLNKTAKCGGGKFYASSNPEELQKIYADIAKEITASSQTVETSITNTTLYGDSYIEFDYTPSNPVGYGEVALTYETNTFNDDVNCEGDIPLPAAGDRCQLIDAKVTSYSAEHWTDYVRVNNSGGSNEAFNLSDTYPGVGYWGLGDPYIVYINPAHFVLGETNTVKILTGNSPTERTNCSVDNRAILTITVKGFSDTGEKVFPSSSGCNWSIEFANGSDTYLVNYTIPSGYTGTNLCNYTSTSIAPDESNPGDDAINYAVYRLLNQLDFSPAGGDGVVDISFDLGDDVNISMNPTANVRSLWGPVEIKLVAWL